MGDLEELFKVLDDGNVHYVAEATIGALGVLCDDHRVYPACPVLVSGDCKRESGKQHAALIQTLIDGIDAQQEKTNFRIVSIASDGESRRGHALGLLTFKFQLSTNSPIYPLLSPLEFMDLHVGVDDITCDKDWKHIIKRARNFLLRPRGIVIAGYRIKPDMIKAHLAAEGASVDHIQAMFKPGDQQDVRTAFMLLRDIWTLPRTTTSTKPGFQDTRKALWNLA